MQRRMLIDTCTPRRVISLAAAAGLLAGCSGAGHQPYHDPLTEAEVLDVLEDYYVTFSARDWDAYADYFWPGADITTVWQPPGEPIDRVVATTIGEFIASAPQGPGSREVFEEWMIEADIRVFNDLAQAWVRYGARFGDVGDVDRWEGVDGFTLLRHGGVWKIAALVFSNETADSKGG